MFLTSIDIVSLVESDSLIRKIQTVGPLGTGFAPYSRCNHGYHFPRES